MILDLLLGRYGLFRQKLMLIWLCFGLIGFAIMVNGIIVLILSDIESLWVMGALWVNGLIFASVLIYGVNWLYRQWQSWRTFQMEIYPATETIETPSIGPADFSNQQYAQRSPKGFYSSQHDAHWEVSDKPVPMDEIMANIDFYTYDQIYRQKCLYEAAGNKKAFEWLLNRLKKWKEHKRGAYWEQYNSVFRLVPYGQVKHWQPPSPIGRGKRQNTRGSREVEVGGSKTIQLQAS